MSGWGSSWEEDGSGARPRFNATGSSVATGLLGVIRAHPRWARATRALESSWLANFKLRESVYSGMRAWAGESADFDTGDALTSAGLGLSFLDGLLRLDLARGLRSPTGWRVELYLDSVL